MKEPWWTPGAIRFSREQVWWLISNLDTIRKGDWPNEHRETGYAGGKNKSHSHSAYYEKSIQISAELLQRIEKSWPDSALLMLSVAYGDIRQVMANGERQDIGRIQRRINSALAYISGRKRKSRSYYDFKRRKRGHE